MTPIESLVIIAYLVFSWLLLVHTLEEIAQGVFDLKLGLIRMTKSRYLRAASFISLINLTTFGLILFKIPLGFYFGLFMAVIPGIVQGIVHTIGFFYAGMKTKGLGVGFYSSIPLSLSGAWLFILLLLDQQGIK
jgi:hypothetical protein